MNANTPQGQTGIKYFFRDKKSKPGLGPVPMPAPKTVDQLRIQSGLPADFKNKLLDIESKIAAGYDLADIRDMLGLPGIGGDTQLVLAIDAPPILPGLDIGGWKLPLGYTFPKFRVPLGISRHAGPGNNLESFKPDSTVSDRRAWMHDMDIGLTYNIVDPTERKRARGSADSNYVRRQNKKDATWRAWLTSKLFNTGLQNVYYSFGDMETPVAFKRQKIPEVVRIRGASKRYKSTNIREL